MFVRIRSYVLIDVTRFRIFEQMVMLIVEVCACEIEIKLLFILNGDDGTIDLIIITYAGPVKYSSVLHSKCTHHRSDYVGYIV